VRSTQGGHGRTDSIRRDDGLDAQLRDTLLPPPLPDRRIGLVTAQERARSGRVPGAPLVVADPTATGGEDGVAGGVERVLGDEPDELDSGQIASSGAGGRSVESPVFGVPSGSMRSTCASSSALGQCSTPRGTT